jgi:Leucine-rich repeat (LRR) protein
MSNPFIDQYTPNINAFIAINNKAPATNSVVPSHSRPLSGTSGYIGSFGKARPIKHWRKQLNPIDDVGRGKAGLGMPMDTPGGSVYLGDVNSNTNCITCADPNNSFSAGIKENIVRTNTIVTPIPADEFYDISNNRIVCVACNPENNIIRSATTLLSKSYYTDTKAYLKSRCLLYDQKLSTTRIPGVTYSNPCPTGCGLIIVQPSDSPNGTQVRWSQNCQQKSCSSGTLTHGTTIYKPSNSQYATQGAVSSSSRIDRLKYNTITQNGASLRSAWGDEGANAGKYQGTSVAPYFLKSKNQPCVNFHTNGNKTVCKAETNTTTSTVQPNILMRYDPGNAIITFDSNSGGYYSIVAANGSSTTIQYPTGTVTIPALTTTTEISIYDSSITSFNCNDNTDLITLTLGILPLLYTLGCVDCALTSLDVSTYTSLTFLYCSGNTGLTSSSLTLPTGTALQTLSCSDCLLTQLNMSTYTSLTFLYCADNTGLTSLTLPLGNALQILSCSRCLLTELNMSTYTSLTDLDCGGNTGLTLTLPTGTALQTLSCNNCALTSLDVSTYTSLTDLLCSDNTGLTLTLPTGTALRQLSCNNCALTSLDVSTYTGLINLFCSENTGLTLITLPTGTALQQLLCSSCALINLDVSSYTDLTYLDCGGNTGLTLTLPTGTALETLFCYNCALTNLDVSSYTGLTLLSCSENTGLTLTLPLGTALQQLSCSNCSLTILDVSTYTDLTFLNCDNNTGLTLTLPTGTALEVLSCNDCGLTSLDVSTYTSLTDLDCGGNTGLTILTLGTNQSFLSAVICQYCNLTQSTANAIASKITSMTPPVQPGGVLTILQQNTGVLVKTTPAMITLENSPYNWTIN